MPRIDMDALEDEWEDDPHLVVRRNRDLSVKARAKIDELASARVVGVDRGRITVLFEDEVVEATLAGTMRGTKAAVGDEVRVRPPRRDDDPPRIVEVLERSTVLTRTADDALDEERVVVANADLIVVVLAADYLDVGSRFLDRVLVAASVGGLETALCVNKADLVDDPAQAVAPVRDRYDGMDLPIVTTSATTGEGLDDLRRLVAGGWTAFAGHSGVGKSSLFNHLVPDAAQAVADIGRYGGRHTTVAAWALRAPQLDAWLVDTPGVRSFGLGGLDATELPRHFPELARLRCDLIDCTHTGEPGCTLAQASVHPERLAAYERLRTSLLGQG
ncbi:MAG: ribosome small subunit-dependent GTPase A [Nitriliruptoraceae bacterium]|nr:ribosome small subunit-dependent GTPase A [Nitriliruptoraceae bacterium]